MKFFTEADFKLINESLNPNQSVRYLMADAANFKLEREGKVIYSVAPNYLENSWFFASGQPNGAMYKALLINVENIGELCAHVGHLQYTKITNDGPEHLRAYCINCHKSFKLAEIEPLKACEHPSEKVSPLFFNSKEYKCSSCNQRVKATKWEASE